jgi:hypothetical protein
MQGQRQIVLFNKFEHLFNRTHGNWNTDQVSFLLIEGDSPFQLPPFLIPEIYKDTPKGKAQHGCHIGAETPK